MTLKLTEITTKADADKLQRQFVVTGANKRVTFEDVLGMLPLLRSESEMCPGKLLVDREVREDGPGRWRGVLKYGDLYQVDDKPLCEKVVAAIADSHLAGFRDALAWAHWCRALAVESQAGDAAEVERLIRERR